MRFDRLITLCIFKQFISPIKLKNAARIPILMYHSVAENEEEQEDKNKKGYYYVNTSPHVFAKHMQLLYKENYSVISLTDAVNNLISGILIPNKPIVITFDDGFKDFYTNAFSVLKKYAFTATVFLPTSYIQNTEQRLKNKVHLNWNEIRELCKEGITFGSHTVTHPQLKLLKNADIDYEIKQSKEIIEQNIGSGVDSFSYPFAFPEHKIIFRTYLRYVLEKFGYKNGVSTRIGTATKYDEKYFLKRIPINSFDDISFFKAKIEGAYDWLYIIQYLTKLMHINLKKK
jgi:peptidoglycan/xylan/chitin deacetylase (PgdA/CDA1 family)